VANNAMRQHWRRGH